MAESEIIVCPDREALSREAARRFVKAHGESIAERGRFTVALAGGQTPRELYSLLAEPFWRDQIDWTRTHLFWGDERFVPPDHADSNYRMAREALLSKVPVPHANVHRIETEVGSAEIAAARYEQALKIFFRSDDAIAAQDFIPRFDLVLLGLGADGHTASLFPESSALDERKRFVVAVWIEKLAAWRITLSVPLLSNAARILFLVSGAEKAEALGAILREERAPENERVLLPAQLVCPTDGRLWWLIDAAAAQFIMEENEKLKRGKDYESDSRS